ncbi:MAG: MATE family efflux transporter [Clostridia bacterium]|nr:MATE family efflux transporter [Clostridia bacterium]
MENETIIPELNNETFNRELLKVAVPIVIQQLIMVCVNLADTVMVGKLSEYALAAVGAANQIYFVVIDCVFGFLSGCAVFAVQYWGIRDLKALRKILGIAYVMVVAFTIPMVAVIYFFAPQLIGIFAKEAEVVLLGTEYIRIACFTYLIAGFTFIISYYSRAIALLKWPTVINAFAVGLNVILNYCLIFGKFGLPELGVKGAAYATLIARSIELVSVMLYVYLSKNHPLGAKLKDLKFDITLYVRVVKTALPVVLNEFLWVLSFTLTFAIYGKISAVALAVVQVAMTITDIFQTIYVGLSNGGAVVIGQALGQGKRDLAFSYSKRLVNISWVTNILTTVLLILIRGSIASIYSFEPETTTLLLRTLVVFALAITPKMFTFVFICGIFRPGGDTMWCFYLDVGLNWLLQVPLAYLSVVVLKWPLEYCIALVALADLVKAVFCYVRLYSKKWINVFTGR